MRLILSLLMWEMNYGAVQASINSWRSMGSAIYSRHAVRMSYSCTHPVDEFHNAASGIAEMEKKLSSIPAENRLCQYLIRKLSSVDRVSSGSYFSLSDASFEVNVGMPVSEMLPVAALPTSEIFSQPLVPSASQILSWLQVQDAGMKGKGLFSLQCIQENTLLGEYLGEVLTQREFATRYPKGDAEYVFLVSEDVQRRDRIYVDAADEMKSNIFR